MGLRIVSEGEKDVFMNKLREANKDVNRREELLDELFNEFERNFILLGGTAVEDRLQDEVPSTINSL